MMRPVTTSRLAAFVEDVRRETAEVWAALVLAVVVCGVATDRVATDFDDLDDRFDVWRFAVLYGFAAGARFTVFNVEV
jgi:hypothetical protein